MENNYAVILEALAPISHGAFSDTINTGNAQQFRREPIVSLPSHPLVPVVSGNALRGKLRRLIMRELFEQVTLEDFTVKFGLDKYKRAWDRLYAAICGGGTIEKAESGGIKTEEIRDMRNRFPALSALGAAMYTQMIDGMVNIGFVWPYCTETVAAGLWDKSERTVFPCEDLVTEVGQTRHINRENANPENSGVTPMPYIVEALATGTMLKSNISFDRTATDLEKSAVMYGLKMLKTIGGKASVGFGEIKVTVTPEPCGDKYYDWMKSTDIKELLLDFAEKVL